jgi:hypothetical protein
MRLTVVALVLVSVTACGPSPSTPPQESGDAIGTRVTVSGAVAGVGGPAPGAPRPWPGTVSWRGPTHGTVRTDGSGRFVLSLPPGRYVVTGRSPRYDGAGVCRTVHRTVVVRRVSLHVDVLCQLR